MREVYDREKTRPFSRKRDLSAGLKTEIGEIATPVSRLLDGLLNDVLLTFGVTR